MLKGVVWDGLTFKVTAFVLIEPSRTLTRYRQMSVWDVAFELA